MNLFLASYRFDRALTAVYRMALPFLAILFGYAALFYLLAIWRLRKVLTR